MNITDYQIISASSIEELQAKVKTAIADGWQTIGPATPVFNTEQMLPRPMRTQGSLYIQTLVKY